MQAHAHNRNPAALSSGILFLEDFEPAEVPSVAEPLPVPPALTDVELIQARETSRADGYQQGLAEARSECAQATRRALETIAASMYAASDTAARAAERHAEALARLLLGVLRVLLPRLCDRFGAEEAAAIALALRPGLRHQPVLRVRANPQVSAAVESVVTEALRDVDPELCDRVRFVETQDVLPGDFGIEWENGAARRDTESLWAELAAILTPLDLLDADAAPLARAA